MWDRSSARLEERSYQSLSSSQFAMLKCLAITIYQVPSVNTDAGRHDMKGWHSASCYPVLSLLPRPAGPLIPLSRPLDYNSLHCRLSNPPIMRPYTITNYLLPPDLNILWCKDTKICQEKYYHIFCFNSSKR